MNSGLPNQRAKRAINTTPENQEHSPIHQDHGGSASGQHETSRIWRHAALRGAELFRGVYTNHEFARHFHAVPAIGVVDRGTMRSYCRKASHLVPERSVVLLNPGEVHAPGPADEQGWSFRVFFFDETYFHARSSELGRKSLRFAKPFVDDERLAQILLHLHIRLEADATTLETETSLHQVFDRLAQKHIVEPVHILRSETDKTRIENVRDYLHAHYTQDVTLTHLAQVAQWSPAHLLRSFRHAIGLTPHAYLIQLRIEAAKDLLRLGNPIADVADITGFTDQSHLSRHFKRITGVTPGRYLSRDVRSAQTVHRAA